MIRDLRTPFQERWRQHTIIPSAHYTKRTLLQWDRMWSLRRTKHGGRVPIFYNRYPVCKLGFGE